MTRTVYIHYETKTREFDGKLLLIAHLLQSFNKVYLGSYQAIKRESSYAYDGIIIFKSLSKTQVSYYKELKKRGFIIVLLHAEGGIHYKDNSSSILSMYNPELLEYVDYNFVYGQTIKDDILRLCGSQFEEKTIVSGEPRFDLLKPKYRLFFEEEIEKLRKRYGTFILINTSFSVANPYTGKENLKNFFLSEPTYTIETKNLLLEKIDFIDKVLHEFTTAIKLLSFRYPNTTFIIRPHPSESEVYYNKLFISSNNVVITKEGNVVNWILASKAVIHYDCTTGMEAALARKPVISYLPIINDKVTAWLPIELSEKAYKSEELLSKIDLLEAGDNPINISQQTIDIWNGYINNVTMYAAELIVDSLVGKKNAINEFKLQQDKIIDLWSSRVKNELSYLKSVIYFKRNDIRRHKFGNLSRKEASIKINQISNIDNLNINDLIITKPFHDLLIMRNR